MDHRRISYVRPLRRRWGLTQSELAFLIGTKTSTMVSRIEAVKTYPSLAQAIAFSIVFDTPLLELFPEMFGKAHDFVLKQAESLYDELQGTSAKGTSAKLDFLEEVLSRAHPHVRDIPPI
jgi:transcriptional regulator with XRE-family HTH domain